MQAKRCPGVILITGAGGLLGANLVLDFSRLGFQVVATGRSRLPTIDGVSRMYCDLTVPEQIEPLLRESRPDYLIHCAALTDVDYCEVNPGQARRLNSEVPGELAAAASRFESRFVYISTDSVFDGTHSNWMEEERTAPVNAYARSKLAGEMAVRQFLPNALIVRTNIYGWNMQPKTSLAEWIVSRLESGSEVPGFEDVLFCPMLVNDLGDMILEMLELELTGLFHVAGSEVCSKYDFALHLAHIFGLDPQLVRPTRIEYSSLAAPRPRNTSLSTARIYRALGKSMPDLNTGLKRFKALRDTGFAAHLKHVGIEGHYA